MLRTFGMLLALPTALAIGCVAIVPYQPKANLVTESGAESAQTQLADLLRRAAAPRFSSVEVDDKRAKLEMLQTHVGAFYQTIQTTIPFDISYSMVGRMELYANNYVYRYDTAGRLMPPHILFASQQDAMLFMDLITSLRDAE